MAELDKQISLREMIHPTDRQVEFFETMDKHKFTLYGGAKGGGKSYILRWACVRQLLKWAKEGFKNVRVVIFCEDYPTLMDRQISKISTEFPDWLGVLSGSQIDGLSFKLHARFGGGVIALRNLDNPSKYASSEFALCAVDEITKNKKETIDQLRSIIRWPGIEDTKFIAGTNPGDIGHQWVKNMFVDKILGEEDPPEDQIAFVKSLPTDNPHNAKSYLAELQRLPEKLRRAYWEGNWDIFEGQFFAEWNRDVHVIKPFELPDHWVKLRSIDPSGRAGVTSCHWYALDTNGTVFVYREYYQSGKDADEHAREIARLSEGESYPYTCIDAAAFNKLGLPETTVEVYERNGVTGLIPSMKNRIMGWDTVHKYLRWNDENQPKIKFFENCKHMIRTIPLAVHDDKNPLDVMSIYDGPEHQDALDELRYLLQTLRDQKSPQALTLVEKRLKEMRDREKAREFNYKYARSL